MTITPEEIARLRALEAKATPGPWECANLGPARNIPAVIQREDDDWVPVAYFSDERGDGLAAEPEHDGNLIVTARNALPDLLDEVERLNAYDRALSAVMPAVLAKQKIERERDAELAELRAYRDRTEAALRDLCARGKDCVPNEDFVTPWDLESRGLWREGGA